MFIIPEYAENILRRLDEYGFESYLAGGCVRDFISGTTPHDYDVTTNALPENIKYVFSDYKIICSGEKHGTITVVSDNNLVEITTYRIDGAYNDHRHPDKVCFTPYIKEDLKRRDFTINSMAFSPKTGLIDPFGGVCDIKSKIIRTTGNPDERFKEDALRILRALRFSSRLGFIIEQQTSEAIFRNKQLISKISIERIRDEFVKIISGKNAGSVLRKYKDVIAVFIPEISAEFNFNQNSPYHKYDVWEHTIHAIDVFNDPIIKLAMFFHDISKPECYTEDINGIGHFKGHALKGAEKTKYIMKRLKFSSKEIELVTDLVKHHSDEINTEYDIKKKLNLLGEKKFFHLLNVFKADCMSKQDFCKESLKKFKDIEESAQNIIEKNICYSLPQMQINGNDLISIGFRGKKIGEILNILLDMIMNKELKNDKTELIICAKSMFYLQNNGE